MDRFTEKQAEIDAKKTAAVASYPPLWLQMTSEWQSPDENDRAWLLYSANYLLSTAGVRWALDPLTLRQRVPSAPPVDVSALAALDYVVLTHRHADHLDMELLLLLRDFPALWVVPEFLLESLGILNLPGEKVLVPHPLEPLHLGSLTLTPFNGLHWEMLPDHPDGRRGVPAGGYLAEFNGKRWLFPGDTRTYDASMLPDFAPLDGLVVPLWLGRGQALHEQPPLMNAFCRFCIDLCPKQVVITHLEEFGRDAHDYWEEMHAKKVKVCLQKINPRVDVSIVQMGHKILL
jgi:L-ascorbate metabolism protein UlaG (beta-lactamase superfamily)